MKFDFLSESDQAYYIHKASTLVEALPYIREHAGQIVVIKYGGHSDQLSRTVPVLDKYRIIVLTKLLKNDNLERRQYSAVKMVLDKKIDLVIKGAVRHKNYELIAYLEKLKNIYLVSI